MRILLQQKHSGLYLNEIGAWTTSTAEAKDFLSSSRALAYCAAQKITDVQLVLKFPEQHYDIVLPTNIGRARPSPAV